MIRKYNCCKIVMYSYTVYSSFDINHLVHVQCTMYIKLRLLLSWSCKLYSVNTTLSVYILHCTVYIQHCTVNILYYTVYIQCTYSRFCNYLVQHNIINFQLGKKPFPDKSVKLKKETNSKFYFVLFSQFWHSL